MRSNATLMRHQQVDVVKFLLNKNANPAKSNKNGWTALHQGGNSIVFYRSVDFRVVLHTAEAYILLWDNFWVDFVTH